MTPNKSIRSPPVENSSNIWCDTSRMSLKRTVFPSEYTITQSIRRVQGEKWSLKGCRRLLRVLCWREQVDWQGLSSCLPADGIVCFLSFFFFCTGVGGEGCFSCHWWKSNSQCLMAGCYFTLCCFLFQQKLSLLLLLFLLAVFASSEVERVQHLVKDSACFASIQIRVPGYPASDALNGNTSTQAGK